MLHGLVVVFLVVGLVVVGRLVVAFVVETRSVKKFVVYFQFELNSRFYSAIC